LTRLLPGENLAMRKMDKIVGRSDDMLIIRGVNVFPTQIEEQILQVPHLVPNYEILVTKKGHMDTLHIRTEMCHNCTIQANQLAQELMKRIKTMIGISVTVEVVTEATLPRSEGKAKRVIDMRQIA